MIRERERLKKKYVEVSPEPGGKRTHDLLVTRKWGMRHTAVLPPYPFVLNTTLKTLRLLLVSCYNDQMGVPVLKASDLPNAQTRPNHVALFLIHFRFLGYLKIARQPIDQKIYISVVLRTFPFWFEKAFCSELIFFCTFGSDSRLQKSIQQNFEQK